MNLISVFTALPGGWGLVWLRGGGGVGGGGI